MRGSGSMRASRQCSTLGSARVDFLGNGRARRSVEGQVVQTESGRLTDKVWSQMESVRRLIRFHTKRSQFVD